jgi:hypothetical protein
MRPPRPPSTRIPSPCPTSSMTTRATPSGRWMTTTASPIVAPSRLIVAALDSRDRPAVPALRPRAVAAGGARRAGPKAPRTAAAHTPPHLATARISTSEAAALAVSHGGPSSRLARGRPAPARTTATIAAYSAHAGSPTSTATIEGAPNAAATPTTSASAPAAIAGGTSGTTTRLTAGATSDSRPNSSRTIGVVAAWAANETPRISASQRRGRPGAPPASRSVRLEPHAMMPAVASTDSRKPASSIQAGSSRSSPATAQPRAAAAVPGRPSSRASSATPAIVPARTTDGEGPTKSTYTAMATAVSTARRRRCMPPAMAASVDATIAMFQPEMATTWLAPAVVNAAARSRSTRSRSPISTPAASPASGSGIARSSPSAATRRSPSSVAVTEPSPGSSSSVSARSVPTAPIRRRYSP